MQITPSVALLLLLAVTSTSVCATSFDCENAVTNVERMICSDQQISRLDEQLNEVYAQRLAESPYLRQSQRDWVEARDACQDRECVLGLYVRRINFLLPQSGLVADPDPLPAFTSDLTPADQDRLQDDASAGGEASPVRRELPEQEGMEGQDASMTSAQTSMGAVGTVEAVAPAATRAVPSEQGARTTVNESEGLFARFLLLATLGGAFGILCIFALSLFGKIVFYYDGRDFAWSLSPSIVAVVAGSVVAILHEGTDVSQLTSVQIGVIALGGCAAALGVWKAFYNAVRYNRSLVIGLLVGSCKTMVSAFMVFSFFANAGRKHSRDYHKGSETGRRERSAARSSFALLALLWFALVNGERVYEKKGWELPA